MEKRGNILFVTTISGFLQKFEMQDVKLLQDMGWEVHYASNFNNPIYECDRAFLKENGIICHDITVQKSPLALVDNFKAFLKVLRIVKEEEIRAVHCHNPVGGLIGRLAGKFGKEKPYVIYTAHGFHFYENAPKANWLMYYPVEKLMARYTNQLVTINREDENLAKKFRLRKHGEVVRIPGVGLDTKRFVPSHDERIEMRKKLGLSDDTFVVLSVGELNENKNHATVIKAIAQMDVTDLKYIICGEGPGREELENLIQELGLQGQVMLCGYKHKIERYMQAADCFVFPSIREGLGMAALEAMACGLPLIAGDNRGTREYARENAIVCESTDVSAYRDALQHLYEDANVRKALGASSIAVAKEFRKENTKQIMKQVYLTMTREVGVGQLVSISGDKTSDKKKTVGMEVS